jgi:chemotaxis protein MotB
VFKEVKTMKMKLIGLVAIPALLMVAGCGPSRKDTALYTKDQEIKRQEREKTLLAEQLEQERSEKGKLMEANQQWQNQNRLVAEENAKQMRALRATIDEMNAKLAREKSEERIEVKQSPNNKEGITLTLAGSLLFDPGKASIKNDAKSMLNKLAATIKKEYSDKYLRIEGHTDTTPIRHSNWKDNLALSNARAQSVHDYLAKECSIPNGKMYTAGFGSNQPLVHPEKTAADRAKNRRVDIVILPQIPVEKKQLSSTK